MPQTVRDTSYDAFTSKEFIDVARRSRVFIPAFNVPYLPMMEPIVQAILEADSLAFIEVARLEWLKFEAVSLSALIGEFRRHRHPRHIRLHLDHVPVLDEDHERVDFLAVVDEALTLGYDSVMVDGSRLSLDENIQSTREAVALAHAHGKPCEAELGMVMGHEDQPLPPYEELFASGHGFTRIDDARRFVQETNCDWLSVAVGNIHGAISRAHRDTKKIHARLNLDHLASLRDATGVPLVLHGGTGIHPESIRGAMKNGIVKINIGTETRQAYESALRESHSLDAAQDTVYNCTLRYLRETAELAGTARLLDSARTS